MQVKFVMSTNEHCDDELQPTLTIVPEITVILFPEDFPMYSVLKITQHAKITFLIKKFSGSIN